MRTAGDRRPPPQIFHDVLLEEALDEVQHTTIRNPTSHFREKAGMRDRVEVALQVRVDHPHMARFHKPVHVAQRILAAQTRPEAVASRFEFVLKDRLDDQLQGRLNHAILNDRYTERALGFALGYVDASYGVRAIAPVPQRLRQFGQVAIPPLRESLHAHAVHSRRPGIFRHPDPSKFQGLEARHLIDQTVPFPSFNSSLQSSQHGFGPD